MTIPKDGRGRARRIRTGRTALIAKSKLLWVGAVPVPPNVRRAVAERWELTFLRPGEPLGAQLSAAALAVVYHETRATNRSGLSALLDVPLAQAAQNVVPVAVTAAESVDRLRNWASGRCLSANQPGIYTCKLGWKATGKSRRSVRRGTPSDN